MLEESSRNHPPPNPACARHVLRRVVHTLHATILQFTMLVILIVTIYGITYPTGKYDYEHIAREDIKKSLYRMRNPDLKIDPSLPDCNYAFIHSTKSLSRRDIDRTILKFDADGISNGSYAPSHCNPLFSTAILVTYRDRWAQLLKFIPYIHMFLRKQNIHYKIFIVEQKDDGPWNKGVLYNVGARIAIAEKFPCLILHDVDLLPLDMANIYACSSNPRHMSASIDKFRYVLPYATLIGGVTAILTDHYTKVNGFSNMYEDWGAEDDDFAQRIQNENLSITRFHQDMSRYIMLRHGRGKVNDKRLEMLRRTNGRHQQDGLSTVAYSAARVQQVHSHRLYTLVRVELANSSSDRKQHSSS